jgi:hypothetical protein
MFTYTIEVVLGVLLVLVLMQLFKKKKPAPSTAPALPQADLANLKVTDAKTGDVLSVAGVGDAMNDLDFTVDRTTWYQAGQRAWRELSGMYRDRRVSLRVSSDEEVEAAVHASPRKLTLEDLGVSEDDLSQMDERQNTGDSFEFESHVWMYRLSREVQVKRDDQPQPTGFYYWEFREQDGNGIIAVRKPEGEPFSVTQYLGIPLADVTVYRKS